MISAVIAILAAAGSAASAPLPPPGSAVQTQPAPAAAATTAPQKAVDKLICRGTENTGSLLPGPKVCHTSTEWEQIRRDSRDYVEASQHNGAQARLPGS
jgi:hypothetical protein